MWWSFGGGLLTGLCVVTWMWWQYFNYSDCDSPTGSGTLRGCCAITQQSTVTVTMSALGHGSAIWAHRAQAQQMPLSHDTNGSLLMDMGSLGVMDLDLSLSLDVFGLRAFDHEMPITRMLLRSTPCERAGCQKSAWLE